MRSFSSAAARSLVFVLGRSTWLESDYSSRHGLVDVITGLVGEQALLALELLKFLQLVIKGIDKLEEKKLCVSAHQ